MLSKKKSVKLMKFMIVLHTLTILLKKKSATTFITCSTEVLIANELEGYVHEVPIGMRHEGSNIMTNPLLWWKEKEKNYPHIAKLARRILCIPATSAPSERVFFYSWFNYLEVKIKNGIR